MTNRPFRFGLQVPASADPTANRSAAEAAAALGYDEFWSSDHIGSADPFLPLQFAADAAPGVRVGPLTLNNEFHHPVMIARSVATLDQLTGGRAMLGLGTGYARAEHDAATITLRPPGERVSRFAETLHVVRSLLDDGTCSFEGQYHQVAIDDLGVETVQDRVPILVGGNGRRVVGLAGRHADLFQYTGLTFGPDGPDVGGMAMGELVKRRDWLGEAAGDRLDDIERSALVQGLAIDGHTATATAEVVERTGLSPDDVADSPFFLLGSTEQVVDKLGRLRASLGITHYVVRDAEAFAPVVAALNP